MADFIDISGIRKPLTADETSDNGVADMLYDMYRLCLTKKSLKEAAETLYLMEKCLRKNKVKDEELQSLPDKVTEYFSEMNKPQPSQKNGGSFYDGHHGNLKEEVYSDVEIALALIRLVGKERVINMKKKWAGVYWYLRWTCAYPVDISEFCDRIESLRLNLPPEYECSLGSIRRICNMSFMRYDVNHMDKVRVSDSDLDEFAICREVAMNLDTELRRTHRGE